MPLQLNCTDSRVGVLKLRRKVREDEKYVGRRTRAGEEGRKRPILYRSFDSVRRRGGAGSERDEEEEEDEEEDENEDEDEVEAQEEDGECDERGEGRK